MSDLLQENTELKRQLLSTSIKLAISNQQIQTIICNHENAMKELMARIPKQSQIIEWMRKENSSEREQLQDLRESTRVELKKFNEVMSDA